MKKIIIFSSSGGRGHISVAHALNKYLRGEFEVEPVYIFAKVLGPIDISQTLSFHKLTGEDLYNYFALKKSFRIINFMYWLGKWYFRASSKRSERLITAYLKKHKPDMVISVVPLVNNEILTATKELDIPFLLIPTDLDTTTFLQNFEKPEYVRFRFALHFDDEDIKKIIAPAQIPAQQMILTGFPIRPDFFEQKNPATIKNEFDVPPEKPVILLLMGGLGSKETYTFSKKLAEMKTVAHILICLGKNEELRKKIEQIAFPPHITVSIIGFTQRISDLLAISDLFITKSGSVSFCEGLYMTVPMLLDATTSVLLWEQLNHHLLKKHGFGEIITDYEQIPTTVDKLLNNPNILNSMKKNLESFEKKQSDKKIRKLVIQMSSNKKN